MLNLPSLLVELRGLLAGPDGPRKNWREIVKQIERHDKLAEIEVARHYVAKAVRPFVEELLVSLDPKDRAQGVKMAGVAFDRSRAAEVLRHHVMDRSTQVRGNARAVIYRLGFDDVALPFNRFRRAGRRDARTGQTGPEPVAPWNMSGWFYGARRTPTRYETARATRKITLAERGLPAIDDAAALAALLGVEEDSFPSLMRPGTATGSPYVEFTIPKAKGGTRTIAAPRAALRALQRKILREILDQVPAHPAAHGFVRKRSTVTNARPHEGAAVVVKLDLRDFFPSIHFRRVLGLFVQLGYGQDVSLQLAGLTTYRPMLDGTRFVTPGVLPQGAPTSPAIANLVARRLDERLAGLAKKVGAEYTRYADDLTFSFRNRPEKLGRILWWVGQIAQQEGFAERVDKRRVLGRGNQQRITGVVVNQGLHVPREARRNFRAQLHQLRGKPVDEETAARLRGFAAYVRMIEPARGAKLAAEVESLLENSSEVGRLVAAIFADPDDDAPRLVLADHYGERGDPRGELITMQCQLARAPNPLRRATLRARTAELLRAHGAAWAAPVPDVTRSYKFKRGFVGGISASAPLLAPRAAEIFGAHPVEDLELTNGDDASVSQIAAATLGPLRFLRVVGKAAGALRSLGRSAPGLRSLSLASGDALDDLPPKLTKLVLAGASIGDVGVARIAKQSHGLEELVLSRCGIGDGGVATLAAASSSRSLRVLALGGNDLTDESMALIAGSENLAGLRRLEIGENEDLADPSPLLAMPSLTTLQVGRRSDWRPQQESARVRIVY